MSALEQQVVLVTGASTGIGAACVGKLIAFGFFVFGSVRTSADAQRLQLRHGCNFTPLIFDLTNDRDILRAVECVDQKLAGANLAGLVNNAGMAVPGPLLHIPMSNFASRLLLISRANCKSSRPLRRVWGLVSKIEVVHPGALLT